MIDYWSDDKPMIFKPKQTCPIGEEELIASFSCMFCLTHTHPWPLRSHPLTLSASHFSLRNTLWPLLLSNAKFALKLYTPTTQAGWTLPPKRTL